MAQMFFGQFLLDEEVIDADCLQMALEMASKEHHRLGALAVEWGYLSEPQVEMIQLEQRNRDCRFGELAIELEFLDRAQTERLLEVQKSRHKPIGEALVELGIIDEVELDDLLDRYHLSLVDQDVIHLGLPSELAVDELHAYLVGYCPKLFRRITHSPMKLRGGRPWNGRSNLSYRVAARIGGDVDLEIGFAACPLLATQLAAQMREEPDDDLVRETIEDSAQEFVQILADAGRRFLRREGRDAGERAVRTGNLPSSGFWFPASTPTGRGILVLKPI
jgi:hypothetical protein